YPMVRELMSATPGSLVSGAGKYGQVPSQEIPKASDVTERVRAPNRRHTSPTSFVRVPSTKPVIAIAAGLVTLGGLIAAVIAFRGGDAPRPKSAVEPDETIEMQSAETAPPQPTPEPVVIPPAPEPPPVPAKIEKPVVAKPVPKVEAKAEPKV